MDSYQLAAFAKLNLTQDQVSALVYVGTLVEAQNRKWGVQNHTDDIWALINGEELGEAATATLEHGVTIGKFGVTTAVSDLSLSGELARNTIEQHFDDGVAKSRVNNATPITDYHRTPQEELSREIGQTASVAVDWLACRLRNNRSGLR